MEDKQKICKLLLAALQATRSQEDLIALVYERPFPDMEFVAAHYSSGSVRKINVSMDSGIAMIRDIIRAIG